MMTLKANPHPGQAEVHRHDARFKVLAAGRRWGKTRLGVNECLDVAAQGGRAWWVSPSYKTGEVGWRPLRRLGAQLGGDVRLVDRAVRFGGSAEVCVRSADNPDSLRGEGLDLAVLDEFAFMKPDTWTEVIRPSLSDRQGKALFISTPKGHNLFWQLWQRGRQDEPGWMAWQFPTSSNPYIVPQEIEDAKRGMPERTFQQEYMAEFMDDAGGVFRHVMDCAIADPQEEPLDGHEYLFGVDWGKHNDYTAIVIMDSTTKQLASLDRFNQIDWALQTGRLKALAQRFRPYSIIAEQNSMGDPLIEQLQREGLPVQPFQTTNASKTQAIEALALAFERGDIGIIPDPVLVGELQAYEMERLPSGMMRYNAPAGMHDDTVMALALAWHGVGGGDWWIW